MKIYLTFLLLIISTLLFSQLNSGVDNYMINSKTLESLNCHYHTKKSPRFKITCRTAFNKEILAQVVDDTRPSEIFDDVEFSQFVRYNLRVRWRCKNNSKIFIGAQTLGNHNPNPATVSYYIGFKKRF